MTYAVAIGETESWQHLCANDDEVYLWRARVNVNVQDAEQLARIAAAVGRAQDYGMNVRGATYRDGWVDVVLTPPAMSWLDECPGFRVDWRTFGDIRERLQQDEDLASIFPGFDVLAGDTLELVGPDAAVDFWKSRSVVWDVRLGDEGGPTQAYEELANMFAGQADDGPALRLLPGASSTAGGPRGSNTMTVLGLEVPVVAVAAVVVGAAYFLWRQYGQRPLLGRRRS